MTRKLPIYWNVSDIPRCDCGKCGGKPEVDFDNLWKYSDKILVIFKTEFQRCLDNIPSILNYPGVMADEEGLRNYGEGLDRDRKMFNEFLVLVDKEIKSREVLKEKMERILGKGPPRV